MSNRVTLDQLSGMPVGEIAALPADWLMMLQEDADTEAAELKARLDLLNTALELRYLQKARERLVAEGKDAGVTRVGDGDYVAKVDLPKRVEWGQDELRKAVETVKSWGSNPDEFVKTKLDVSETAFKAWPSEIKAVFAPARTVDTGKPKIRIEPAKSRAA